MAEITTVELNGKYLGLNLTLDGGAVLGISSDGDEALDLKRALISAAIHQPRGLTVDARCMVVAKGHPEIFYMAEHGLSLVPPKVTQQ